MRHLYQHVIAVFLSCLLLPAMSPGLASAARDERCFAETGQCIAVPLDAYWEQHGGLFVLGYPLTPLRSERVAGKDLQIQWFERERLALLPDGRVVGADLGVELLALRGTPWETLPRNEGRSQECRFFSATGHSICNPDFLFYFERAGGVEAFGNPISAQLREVVDGQERLVQYFEKKRMEWHPNPQAEGGRVLLGRLGAEILQHRP